MSGEDEEPDEGEVKTVWKNYGEMFTIKINLPELKPKIVW